MLAGLTPAVAAIVGAGVGALATSLAAVITAITSSRRERRARLFTERMSAYTDFMSIMGTVQAKVIQPPENDTDVKEFARGVEAMQLIGSKKVRALVPQVWPILHELLDARLTLEDRLTEEQRTSGVPVKDAEVTRTNTAFNAMYERVQAAMRSDLDNK